MQQQELQLYYYSDDSFLDHNESNNSSNESKTKQMQLLPLIKIVRWYGKMEKLKIQKTQKLFFSDFCWSIFIWKYL